MVGRFWSRFTWLAGQALEFLFIPLVLVLTLVFLALAGWLFLRGRHRKSAEWKTSYWLIFSQLLFFPLGILIGATWPAETNPFHRQPPNSYADWALTILSWLSFANCVFWIWYMRGFRVFATFLGIAQQLFVSSAFLIAGMSITGDWL